MIACFDVQYLGDGTANAAALLFENWDDAESLKGYSCTVPAIAEYEPGEFYRRELEPLKAVITLIEEQVSVYVVDAYCTLSADGAPGLGAHLSDTVGGSAPVIGVAKNQFRSTSHAREVLRGESDRPLFVTAIGMPLDDAASNIGAMHGEFRMPTLLKAVDALARGRT